MESEIALAALKAIQIPITLLAALDLTGLLFPPEREVKNNSCFDVIIVGGGTAGCVLANRLTENNSTRVLVLEAGGNPDIPSFFPPLFPLFPHSEFDWDFKSKFDNYAANAQNNYTKLTAGKVLGGTSTINHFTMQRGAPEDYNKWADIVDDPSWNYENVLPYFKKKETLEDQDIIESEYAKFHGFDGPISLTRLAKPEAVKYVEAFNETGNRTPLDVNGDIALGYAQSLFSASNKGLRQSSAFKYLTPIRDRLNLYVLRYSTVIKIIFDGKKAVGVVVVRNGKNFIYRASKEVIVSAGVYNTPKLLMLSGVGPKKHLKKLGIPVIAHLPVGKNYRDQVAVSVLFRTELSILPPPLYSIELTNVPFPVIAGLKALNPRQLKGDYLDFALLLAHDTPFLLLACAIVFQFRSGICDDFNNQVILHDSLYTLLAISHPKSRGVVTLNSTNPFDAPLITTGYFSNKRDLENMVEYIKDFINVGNSTFFKKIGAKLITPNLEECSNYTFGTDDYWRCYVLHNAGSIYHASSTCAMGAVVDSKLRVKNLSNIRIVDASVMPTLTSGGPAEAVYMIAEKAADMIKEDLDRKSSCDKLNNFDESELAI